MKRILSFLLLLMLLMLLLPACALCEPPRMIVATDLHYIAPSLTDHGAYFTQMIASGDGKMVMAAEELTDAFLAEIVQEKPACLILSGDLTFNGARESHEALALKLRAVDQAGIPVLVLPGNHDLYSYAAARFEGEGFTRTESVTAEAFARIYHDLGFDAALSCDPYSLSYIAEPIPGVRVLLLDTNTKNMECAVAQNTFSWIQAVLARAQTDGAKVIAVSHQNLYAHSELLHKGYVIANASKLLSLYERFGVAVNLSGHLHMQHTLSGSIPEIATSALCVSPCQYGVIDLESERAQYFTRRVDVSRWAQEKGLTDANLLRFREYAAGFFAVTAINQALPQLAGQDDVSGMATWLANFNAAYFSGRMDTVDAASDYARRWQESGTFFGEYVKSILAEPLIDHTSMQFPL